MWWGSAGAPTIQKDTEGCSLFTSGATTPKQVQWRRLEHSSLVDYVHDLLCSMAVNHHCIQNTRLLAKSESESLLTSVVLFLLFEKHKDTSTNLLSWVYGSDNIANTIALLYIYMPIIRKEIYNWNSSACGMPILFGHRKSTRNCSWKASWSVLQSTAIIVRRTWRAWDRAARGKVSSWLWISSSARKIATSKAHGIYIWYVSWPKPLQAV